MPHEICTPCCKRIYASRREAKRFLRRLLGLKHLDGKPPKWTLEVYRCLWGNGLHIGHNKRALS